MAQRCVHQQLHWQRGEGVQGEGVRDAMHVQCRAWGIQQRTWAGQLDETLAEFYRVSVHREV